MNELIPKDRMRLWRDRALGANGVELLAARCHRHDYKPHFHAEFVIACFADGAQAHQVGRRDGVAKRGHVLVIPAGEAHAGRAVDPATGWTYRAFYPDAVSLNRFAEELFVTQLPSALEFGAMPLFHDERMARRLYALHSVIETEAHSPLLRQQAFGAAMSAVLRRYARPGHRVRDAKGERAAVRRARDLAHARFADPDLDVHALADVARLSDFHFMRVFRAQTGLTVHAYVLQLRLACARSIISKGTPLAEAAVAAGFADQSHLTRQFVAAFGVTPGAYSRETAARAVVESMGTPGPEADLLSTSQSGRTL